MMRCPPGEGRSLSPVEATFQLRPFAGWGYCLLSDSTAHYNAVPTLLEYNVHQVPVQRVVQQARITPGTIITKPLRYSMGNGIVHD